MPTLKKNPKKHRQEYNIEQNNKYRKLRHTFYNSNEWRKLRESHLKESPICIECLRKGKIVPADQVHHKNSPFNYQNMTINYDIALDDKNLESICAKCHGLEHSGNKNKMTPEEILKELEDLFDENKPDSYFDDEN